MMLTRWLVPDRAKVVKGTELCEIEVARVYDRPVSDSVVRIKSPVYGIVEHVASSGDILPCGGEIARIRAFA